jgi:hypothetical protein
MSLVLIFTSSLFHLFLLLPFSFPYLFTYLSCSYFHFLTLPCFSSSHFTFLPFHLFILLLFSLPYPFTYFSCSYFHFLTFSLISLAVFVLVCSEALISHTLHTFGVGGVVVLLSFLDLHNFRFLNI